MIPNAYTWNFMNKHAIRLIMVCVIEKALKMQISASENRLLNVLRSMICKTGIFDIELSQVELAFGSDSSTITSN